ncbi:MAG TPA: patatin-like phospholipase family protein [Chthoniobacterales bacterium]
MKTHRQILKDHPVLSLLPWFTLRRLVDSESIHPYPKGTVLCRAGAPCRILYVVLSGRCKIFEGTRGTGHVLGPGDMIGELECIHDEPYRSTVHVVTDSVLACINASALRAILDKKPQLSGLLSNRIHEQIRHMHEARAEHDARRVVGISSLSAGINDVTVSGHLAAALQTLTGRRVLLTWLVPDDTEPALESWETFAVRSSNTFCFSEHVRQAPGGYSELHLSARGNTHEAACIAPMLGHFGQHYDFVILHLLPELPVSVAMEAMIQTDLTYILLQPDAQAIYDFQLLSRQLCAQANGSCDHVRPVMYLDGSAKTKDLAAFYDTLREHGHSPRDFARGFPTPGHPEITEQFAAHIRHLAREIAGRQVGLALSSGGAKGLAHIGVIQVLEENGIEIDLVAGSSIGAYVGAAWCHGLRGRDIEGLAREIESRWGLLKLIAPVFPPRRGFLRVGKVERRLRRSIGNVRFSDLRIPLKVIATSLDSLERIVFSTGEVADAVVASIAIPGVCVPVKRDGEMLIDGGISDPLPVDVLREAGIDRIIAVNTIPTPEQMRQWAIVEHETSEHVAPHRIRSTLFRHFNYFARGNVLDTMMRAIYGVQMRVAEIACHDIDIVLRPLDCDGRWHDFAHPARYIALGRQAAEERLPEILSLANDSSHDHPQPSLALVA